MALAINKPSICAFRYRLSTGIEKKKKRYLIIASTTQDYALPMPLSTCDCCYTSGPLEGFWDLEANSTRSTH